MSLDPVKYDAVEIGLGRLATQYRESTNLRAYLTALLSGLNDLEQVVNDVALRRTLESPYNEDLNIIGELVGQSRIVVSAVDNPFFGFWDGTTVNEYLGFSTDGFGDGGAFWNGESPDGRELSNAEYATFIRARIVRNISKGTHTEMLKAFKFILGESTIVDIQDATPGNITIGISRPINDAEQYLLTSSGLTPKPGGVGIQQWYTYVPTFALGLSDGVTGYSPTGSIGLGDGSVATPDATPRTAWSPLTYLAAVDQWINPNNGYLYKPLTSAGGPSPRSGLSEPIWRAPTEADPRFPGWSLGYSYDVEGMTEWSPGVTYASGFRIRPGDSISPELVYVSSGGTSDTVRPVGWPTSVGGTISDGSIIWTAQAFIVYDVRVRDPINGGILASGFE